MIIDVTKSNSPGITKLSELDIDIAKDWGGWGITNLGNTSLVGTLNVGVDGTGHDVKFFGATAGKYLLWDESLDGLRIEGSMGIGKDPSPSTTSLLNLHGTSAQHIILSGTTYGAGNSATINLQTGLDVSVNKAGWSGFQLASGLQGSAILNSWIGANIYPFILGGFTGTIVDTWGVKFGPLALSGNLTNVVGYGYAPLKYGGVWTNVYGIKFNDVVQGANNWVLHTGLGLISVGDDIEFRNDNDKLLFGVANDGAMFWDSSNLIIDPDYASEGYGELLVGATGDDNIRFRNSYLRSDAGFYYAGGGDDLKVGYDGVDGIIDTSPVAPSDLLVTCGANKTIELQNVVYEDIQVSVSTAKLPASNSPTWRTYNYGVAGGVTFPALGFAVDDYFEFFIQTSHSMKLNTILDNHIHWTIPSDSTGDKVKFQLDVIAAGINVDYAKPTGSPFTSERTLNGTEAGKHNLLGVADIPSSNTTVSSMYICRLTRIAASSDEYANEVYVTYDDSHYQKNTMGSRQEAVK